MNMYYLNSLDFMQDELLIGLLHCLLAKLSGSPVSQRAVLLLHSNHLVVAAVFTKVRVLNNLIYWNSLIIVHVIKLIDLCNAIFCNLKKCQYART